jgi:hypothetical protein
MKSWVICWLVTLTTDSVFQLSEGFIPITPTPISPTKFYHIAYSPFHLHPFSLLPISPIAHFAYYPFRLLTTLPTYNVGHILCTPIYCPRTRRASWIRPKYYCILYGPRMHRATLPWYRHLRANLDLTNGTVFCIDDSLLEKLRST